MKASLILLLAVLCIAGCAATDQDRTPLQQYLHQKGLE